MLLEHSSPDKAVRFSNLYSRLLTQPVLSQKWAILYLLHKISDSDSLDVESLHSTPGLQHNGSPSASRANSVRPKSASGGQVDGAGSSIDEAFSTPGLPRLPVREPAQSRPRGIHKKPGEDNGSINGNRVNGSHTGQILSSRPAGEDRQQGGQGADENLGAINGDSKEPHTECPDRAEDVPEQEPSARPPETALLRDLPFTLQGLSSTNLAFTSPSTLTLPPTLPVPLISLLHTLAEPSLLYRGLSGHIQSSQGGLIAQSLKAAIGQELRSYLGLVATLEGEIRRALASLDKGEPRNGIGKAGVTLKRCVVWTREATMGLRLMSLMVEESKSVLSTGSPS